MIAILTENKAQKLFKYRNVAAMYTYGDNDEYRNERKGIVVSYMNNGIMPDEDVINACVSGDKKMAKFAKRVANAIISLKTNESKLILDWATTMRMAGMSDDKKTENLVIFILPDAEGDNAQLIKKKNKVYTQYIQGVLKAFHIKAVTEKDKKDYKTFMKCFYAGKKKKRVANKQMRRNLADFCRNNSDYSLSSKGAAIITSSLNYYRVESDAAAHVNLFRFTVDQAKAEGRESASLKKKQARKVADTFKTIMLCDNVLAMGRRKGIVSTKELNKSCKRLRKKNEKTLKIVNHMVELINGSDSSISLDVPKLKCGRDVNLKAKKKKQQKKVEKRFVKTMDKLANPENAMNLIIVLDVAAYALQNPELKWGTDEFITGVRKRVSADFGKNLGNWISKLLQAEAKATASA